MKTIQDLLARDLSQRIEEIIKVNQADEQTVYTEITEYVATDRIKQEYKKLLKGIAEMPSDPHEGIGVWVSGFFGSGKSSFAKNMGYVLSDRLVNGERASELFKGQVADQQISNLVDSINVRIPSDIIMFDVSDPLSIRSANEKIAEIMYTMLLRELDYAEDYDIAELEFELEQEGKLAEFIAFCTEIHQRDWRMVRKGASKMNKAGAILSRMDPVTYPTADSWAKSLGNKTANLDNGTFIQRAFDLFAMRRPGKALVFILDEVGAYVARSTDKINDLRVLVEQFGKIGKNLYKAKKIPAPAWIIITSQEKLNEVVAALDSKKVELARVQDRFKFHIDLAPADIREVTTRRVLSKKDEAIPLLQQLFRGSQGQLNAACKMERTTRKSEIPERDFVQFYPYLPHFVELSIDIMSGIRLQPGADKHIGGSNRTIIKQTYEMLVNERTDLASKPIGTLVTLDKIYYLVEGNMPSEKQKDISDIAQRFKDDPDDQGMTSRVAQVIALLEFVHDLPRTEVNIAACLVDRVGSPSPLPQVQQALEKLRVAQFVRNTEEGWKLQTAQEKSWDSERREISPKSSDRNTILREMIGDALDKVKVHKYGTMKNFRVGIKVDQVAVGDEGQIPLLIVLADDSSYFASNVSEVRTESRQDKHKNGLYWVFALTPEIDDLVVSLFASRRMSEKYNLLAAQQRISSEESTSLLQEKNESAALQRRLRDKITQAMEIGEGLFRGVSKEADTLGKALPEMLRNFFDFAIPDLYPKLEMGARNLKGDEAEKVLNAANLNGLPEVFYNSGLGLNLIIKENDKYVPNPNADVAKEILNFLKSESNYGTKVTGKSLEDQFQGLGYGWERDMLRMVLAVLLRAGAIEITHQGKRYRDYQNHQAREPLTKNPAFKAASFAPRESVSRKTLTNAVESFAQITGQEVDVEEGAIVVAIKKLANEENRQLHQVIADAKANNLPVVEVLTDYQQTLEQFEKDEPDECIQLLVRESRSIYDAHAKARNIRHSLTPEALAQVRQAHRAANEMVPALERSNRAGTLSAQAITLRGLITSENFYTQLARIAEITQEISAIYQETYVSLHDQRATVYEQAIDEIKGYAEWPQIPAEMQTITLTPLNSHICTTILDSGGLYCSTCHANLATLDADLAAVSVFTAQVLIRIRELTTPAQSVGVRTERLRLTEFFTEPLDSTEAVDLAITKLADHLHKLVEEGVRIIVE